MNGTSVLVILGVWLGAAVLLGAAWALIGHRIKSRRPR